MSAQILLLFLKRVDDIVLEINDKNYEFLLDIISEITLDKEKEELFSMFDIFFNNVELVIFQSLKYSIEKSEKK